MQDNALNQTSVVREKECLITSIRFERELNHLEEPVATIDHSAATKLKKIIDFEYQRYAEVLSKANVKSVDDFETFMVLNGEQLTDDIKIFVQSLDTDINKSNILIANRMEIYINFSFVVSAEKDDLNKAFMYAEKSAHIKSVIGKVLSFDNEVAKCDEDSRHLQHKIELYKKKFHEHVLQIKVSRMKFFFVAAKVAMSHVESFF